MSEVSYKFRGENILAWARYGGVPVWCKAGEKEDGTERSIQPGRLLVMKGGDYLADIEGCVTKWRRGPIELRYTKLEEIIDDAPDWAATFEVAWPNRGVWRGNDPTEGKPVLKIIRGHIFSTKQYPERIDLKEFREGMK